MADWVFGSKPEIHVDIQFPYERLRGLVKQNTRNPELTITNTGHINVAPLVVDASMFVLTSSHDDVLEQVIMSYTTHGHSIFEPELKTGLSVTASLLGIQSWVKPVAYDVRIEMFRSEDKKKFIMESIFLIDQNGIVADSKMDSQKVHKIRTAISTFINREDKAKTLTLTAPMKGVWLPSVEPGVDIRVNKDGSATIRTTK